jgi:predicted PurR-regulated permease PerM
MDERRLAVAAFGVAVAVIIGAIAVQFIAALSVSVFLYYSVRRYHKALRRLRLPARIRAMIVLLSLAIPLLLLIGYAVVLLIIEAREFVEETAIVGVASEQVPWFGRVDQIPEFTVSGIYQAYQSGQLDGFIQFATNNATFLTNLVSGFFLNLFIVVVVTYYLLVDGERIRSWLLRFDDDAIIREYLEAVDRELEAVFFGNLLNVIATSLIAIAVFRGYNLYVPAGAHVPYPTLAGGLTGIASLVPVVGMKIVYVPLTLAAGANVVLNGEQSLLGYVAVFAILAVVVVDTIPDLVLRPLLSGEATHVGLLMLAYTLGPIVLGFYGFFFAPILLVVGLMFATTALPRLLGVDPEETEDGLHRDQLRLEDFAR